MNAVPPLPATTTRANLIARLLGTPACDVAVIGGGATGLGIALEAAQRGLRVVLVEADDFASGTSSRSTKLLHGGVRYLAKGQLHLVREALRERAAILASAPHLASALPFVVPTRTACAQVGYRIGLTAYDWLSGAHSLGPTRGLGAAQLRAALPGLAMQDTAAGVCFWDAQFDDARMAIALARTAAQCGALLLNHCVCEAVLETQGRVSGIRWRDAETGASQTLRAGCVINAAGAWAAEVFGHPIEHESEGLPILLSRGVHLVVPQSHMSGDHALLVPRTSDGRVLFAVPWLGQLLLGTTDTPQAKPNREPEPSLSEANFILREFNRMASRPVQLRDVRSAWAGLRPLVPPSARRLSSTQAVSREHRVHLARNGLISVLGGKWTTYRVMAHDALAVAMRAGSLPAMQPTSRGAVRLCGAPMPDTAQVPIHAAPGLHLYGGDAVNVQRLPGAEEQLAPGLSAAMVRFAVRHECARTVIDVLARRSRLLMLDAQLAGAQVPRVAELMQEEGVTDPKPERALALARAYATNLHQNPCGS